MSQQATPNPIKGEDLDKLLLRGQGFADPNFKPSQKVIIKITIDERYDSGKNKSSYNRSRRIGL